MHAFCTYCFAYLAGVEFCNGCQDLALGLGLSDSQLIEVCVCQGKESLHVHLVTEERNNNTISNKKPDLNAEVMIELSSIYIL